MKILIAPDKFKGTLDARDVAQNIARGLLDVLPDAQIEIVPMADGGEGTAEAICAARDCSWVGPRSALPEDRCALWVDRPTKTRGDGDERGRGHAAAFRN